MQEALAGMTLTETSKQEVGPFLLFLPFSRVMLMADSNRKPAGKGKDYLQTPSSASQTSAEKSVFGEDIHELTSLHRKNRV